MADVRSAWQSAGDRLSGLGLKLKLHYEQQRAEDEAEDEPRPEVKEAVKRLADAVQDTFEAMGSAVKDPAVRADVKQVGQSLTDALGVTFAEVSDELRKAFRSSDAQAPGGERPAARDEGDGDGEDEPPRATGPRPPRAG